MAVVKLKEVSIIGKLSELDKVATICGQSNVFHSDNAMNFYADTPDFTAYNEDNPYAEPLQQLNDAIVKANKTLTLLDTKETKNIHMDNDAIVQRKLKECVKIFAIICYNRKSMYTQKYNTR